MKAAKIVQPLLLGLFFSGYLWCHQGMFTGGQTPALPGGAVDSGSWAVPTLVLQVLAGEFKGLLADLLVVEAGSHLGIEIDQIEQIDWETVIRLFRHSQALDPYFLQTVMVVQGWLPWTAKQVPETMEFLTVAAKYRSWDYQPLHFLAFNSYYFLHDSAAAGRYFLAASTIANAPPYLAILGARFSQKGGETATAIAMLRAMLASKPENEPGYDDLKQRLAALEGSLVLEKAVQKYKEEFGGLPESLATLVTSGVLVALPDNPYNLDYCLDRAGNVYFDKPDCQTSIP